MAKVTKRWWKTSSGQLRTAWQVSCSDRSGKRQKKQFKTKREADDYRISAESSIRAGAYRSEAQNLKVEDAMRAYLAYCVERHVRNERMCRLNLEVYDGHVRNHILNAEIGIGAIKLRDLTTREIGDFRDRLRNSKVSVPTTRKILGTVRTALEYCVSQDWIAHNPARAVRVIAPAGEGSQKITPPTPDEVRRLVNSLTADQHFRMQVLFACLTGARAGEQRALRWSDIDFRNRKVHIRRAIDRFGREGPPKTDAGNRDLPLCKELEKALKAHRLSSAFSQHHDFIFPNERGLPASHDNLIKRNFTPAVKRAELKKLNWHALRHFAVSTWIDAGMTPKQVQTYAGHASLQTTMDRYGHLFPKEEYRDQLDAIARGLTA